MHSSYVPVMLNRPGARPAGGYCGGIRPSRRRLSQPLPAALMSLALLTQVGLGDSLLHDG